MFFLRLTLYTCALYFAFALPIIVAELVIEYLDKRLRHTLPRAGCHCGVCRILGDPVAYIVPSGFPHSFPIPMGKALLEAKERRCRRRL
jgi:hypothetical protein